MNKLEYFNHIRTFIFDVDGVLTNSQLLVTEEGDLLRQMNTRDGYAIHRAIAADYNVAIITGGNSKGVVSRLKKLGIVHVYASIQNKMESYRELVEILNVEEDSILYMGDDVPDQEVMMKVGMPVCPADAASEILQIAKYVSPKEGGKGCVRDVIEKVMRLHGKW